MYVLLGWICIYFSGVCGEGLVLFLANGWRFLVSPWCFDVLAVPVVVISG